MQWLYNIATDFANTVYAFLPLFCYAGSIVFGIVGALDLHNAGREPHRKLRFLGGACLAFVVAAILAGFPAFLNQGTATLGGDAQAALGGGLLAYSDAATFQTGGSLRDSFIALVDRFRGFFMAFGALMVLRGVLRLSRPAQEQRRVLGFAAVHIVAGVVLINIRTVVPWIMGA